MTVKTPTTADDQGSCADRVLIYTPFGRDAEVICGALAEIGIVGRACASIAEFRAEFAAGGAGAGILTAEQLAHDDLAVLAEALAAQPPWSDLPLIVLFLRTDPDAYKLLLKCLAPAGNLNILERPLSKGALLNAVTLALRARRRQYEARAYMRELAAAKADFERARNEAIHANDAKTRFLAAASHDLRQPFQAMRLFHHMVTVALADGPAAPAAARLGEAMQSGEELLKALLDVSTLEAGVIKPAITEFPLADVLLSVANDLGSNAASKGLELRVRPCAAYVRSDQVLLKRIVRNLAVNAIRYTERGAVLLACRVRGAEVQIQVWDTGIGIAADKLETIFEDFYQVNNSERDRVKGIGLGLSIVVRMARLLGHEVSVRSKPGRGSVFTVTVAGGAAPAPSQPA